VYRTGINGLDSSAAAQILLRSSFCACVFGIWSVLEGWRGWRSAGWSIAIRVWMRS
jgi:hypothetical protein